MEIQRYSPRTRTPNRKIWSICPKLFIYHNHPPVKSSNISLVMMLLSKNLCFVDSPLEFGLKVSSRTKKPPMNVLENTFNYISEYIMVQTPVTHWFLAILKCCDSIHNKQGPTLFPPTKKLKHFCRSWLLLPLWSLGGVVSHGSSWSHRSITPCFFSSGKAWIWWSLSDFC